MFQVFLFVSSLVAFIVGGLIVLIGIGAITGCAGGLIAMIAGGFIALLGIWSAVTFMLPSPEPIPGSQTVNLVRHNGKWY